MEIGSKQTALAPSPSLLSEIVEWSRQFPAEFGRCWRQLPNKGVFFPLLIAWLLLFQLLGNATLGYIDTASLLYWMKNTYSNTMNHGEDGHGLLIPPVVLALMWWKRKQLLSLNNRLWTPALALLAVALAIHILGYLVQQPRISIVALFVGIYALMGLAWGPDWLRKSFFPFFLFAFCIPITSIGEPVTVPLRILVAKIVTAVSNNFLAMNVQREGTQLFNPTHSYGYEVAAACSGLRSLVAIVALSIIYGFMTFDKGWKRGVIILSAVPLAIIGNVLRMLGIIVAAELWGRDTGNFVHENWFFSIVPYIPAIVGVMLLGHWLREPEPGTGPEPSPALPPKPA